MMPAIDALRVLALPAIALLVVAWVLSRPTDPDRHPGWLTVFLVVCAIVASAVALLAGIS